ncbi:MAG: lipopolysaccharide transport periplasmic protein LptA [Caldimicrobium sp.]
MLKKFIFFGLLIIISLISFKAFAKDINITADKMEVYEDDGIAVFKGKVFAETKGMKLWADTLYVYYTKGKEGRQIQRVIALGSVKMEKGSWNAVSGKATYFKTQEKLVLEDNPKVWHDKNFVEGDIIVIYFNEDRSEVISKSGGRVRVKIHES